MSCRNSLAFLLAVVLSCACGPRDRYVSFSGFAQGGTYTVKLNLNGCDGMIRLAPEQIKDSVENILRDIDNSLSGYNRNSILSRFNAGEAVVPDSLFLDIYTRAWEFYDETSGAVDVASAPLFDIWGFGFKSGNMPDDDLVGRTKAFSGLGRMKRDMSAVLREDGSLSGYDMLSGRGDALPALNYNAIAQGYSCDMVATFLRKLGVRDMMVDIGEIYCAGRNPSGNPWTIGIDRPVDGNDTPGSDIQGVFSMPEGSWGVVTSGNYRKFYVVDGKKYAHTIDPRTGYPVGHNLLSATIVAPDATSADAYATYCMVIGLEASKDFLESRDGVEGCLVYDEDGLMRTWTSDGFVLR